MFRSPAPERFHSRISQENQVLEPKGNVASLRTVPSWTKPSFAATLVQPNRPAAGGVDYACLCEQQTDSGWPKEANLGRGVMRPPASEGICAH